MFNYIWTRKPDFKNIALQVNYNDYWVHRGWEVKSHLKNREKITLGLIPAGARAADIGCGNSLLPIKLKEKGVRMTVADVSNKVLEGYSKYGISGIVLDLEKKIELPEKYDYIMLFEVLEHLKNPESVLKELSAYTDRFLITVPNSAAYFYRFHLMFNGRFFTQWVYHPSEHLRYWSHRDFLDWLDALDLKVLSTTATDGFTLKGLLPQLPNLWKNFLSERVLYVCEVNK